jgi:hypothetical protein
VRYSDQLLSRGMNLQSKMLSLLVNEYSEMFHIAMQALASLLDYHKTHFCTLKNA